MLRPSSLQAVRRSCAYPAHHPRRLQLQKTWAARIHITPSGTGRSMKAGGARGLAVAAAVAVVGYGVWRTIVTDNRVHLDAERPRASSIEAAESSSAPNATEFLKTKEEEARSQDALSPSASSSSSSSPTIPLSETVSEPTRHDSATDDAIASDAAQAVSESADGEGSEGDAADGSSGGGGAFNPVTGEINWDCPCLGGMAHGPCGPEFREAFSCFVFSEEEPKGINCVDKFRAMQDCFRQHPDVYGEDIMADDEDDEAPSEEGTPAAAEGSDTTASPSSDTVSPAT